MTRPAVVGLVGGVGSGKSTVARLLGEAGARVIDADALAHQALDAAPIRDAVVARFGAAILDREGRVDRARLRPLVFGTTPAVVEARRFLEGCIHPEVRRRIASGIAAAAAEPAPPPLIVLDVPLLVEGPVKDACDTLVFVEAPDEARLARTRSTRKWSENEHRARESSQADLASKRAACTHVVVNTGTLDELRERVVALLPTLVATPRRGGSR